MMIATDATLVEINPLAETNDGRVVAADAKLNFDDNAEYRQKQIFAKRDLTQEDPREVGDNSVVKRVCFLAGFGFRGAFLNFKKTKT